MSTLSNYSEVLKTYYLPGIQDYLNNARPLANMIEVNEKDVSGKNATIETHYGRSTGTGWIADGGALPTASYQKFKTCTVPMRYGYGRVNFTGPTIAATREEKGAYAKVIDTEFRGISEDLMKEVNRQYYGAGYGHLARWLSDSSSSSTLTVQKKYRGNATGGDCFGSTFGAKYLDKRNDGYVVVCSSLSGSGTYVVDATNLAVSAFTKGATSDAMSVTSASVSEAAGTFIIRKGALASSITTSGGHRREMMGLRGLVTDEDIDTITLNDGSNSDAGTTNNDPLQGLAVGTYPWFKSIVNSHASGRYAGQRALTLELMQEMFDMVEEQAGKDYGPDLMMTTRAIRRQYLELVRADRRQVNTMELDGGWSALDYNGVPLMVDNDAIDGEIYYLTLKDIQLYRMSDYNWMDKDGAILSRVSGYDQYEAALFRYAELGIKNRATQGVLTDIAYNKSASEGYGG